LEAKLTVLTLPIVNIVFGLPHLTHSNTQAEVPLCR
jgi:hypothetical protein